MIFVPPRCPRPSCPSYAGAAFRCERRGVYARKCDGRTVQRFRCSCCGRFFSTQSFRTDYRLKRPHLHIELFGLLVSKVTLRQAARVLRASRNAVEHRLRLLGDHCRAFHGRRLAAQHGKLRGTFLLDELETFEQHRRFKPLTVPVQIEQRSLFVVDVRVAPLAPRGGLSPALEAEKRGWLRREGRRRSGSRRAVGASFARLAELHAPDGQVEVITDCKASYRAILERNFGPRLCHRAYPGRAPRTTHNPLFPINLSLAMLRDGLSRLVRRTWAHTKLAERLERHLWTWVCWRNYVRGRTNRTPEHTPAMALGVTDRRWRPAELLRWNPKLVG
jgi:transposase-like protein